MQRVQRLMRTASGPKPIRKALKVHLVDLIEDRDHRLLNDFVFQRRDAQRTGTRVPRSVSGACRVRRRSPRSAPFPPQPPPRRWPLCSVASQVLRRSPTPPWRTCPAGGDAPSRFSCLLFLGVPGLFDYAGPGSGSRCNATRRCGLPADRRGSAPESTVFAAPYPAHRCLYLRFACRLAEAGALRPRFLSRATMNFAS